ncbi:hypothetical protein UB45_17040 [Terrabacter sp. 28]|nr:hypothetical protein UB45_17040 [Terrabacter sp. 28]
MRDFAAALFGHAATTDDGSEKQPTRHGGIAPREGTGDAVRSSGDDSMRAYVAELFGHDADPFT